VTNQSNTLLSQKDCTVTQMQGGELILYQKMK